ncbi:hypothetical protein T4B_9916 [Trichinella pseudospiralis]|uniref:Uncharacterized protein n=2 Tax=Trichinella pseudospiralis TaxID=6337 RepID=A0A0V1FJH8_TRIPS|nr:hypothetical protein T4E_12143 [Trichinella pseudospiralis]KRY68431.1 hypothetical protein T4A_11618 [Trichinella pseudospiralis]KRY86198.1 hypothetical protein T4D_4951 [Trichinella pseudospiralis]KRZ25834.1 hypothetical protein T4B_9916 [Trichinella pseudospiralis]KRZ37867.1 hypothetical protein T4C_7769 [Trichinella pseudospiralis]
MVSVVQVVSFAIAFCAFCIGHQRNDSCAALPKQQRTAESFTCASVIHLALLVTAFDIVIAGRRANVKSNRSLLRTSRISEADGLAWTYGSSYATYRSPNAGSSDQVLRKLTSSCLTSQPKRTAYLVSLSYLSN